MNNDEKDQTLFDHSTHQEFVDYYAKQSLTDASIQRMRGIYDCINRNLTQRGVMQKLNVADIGCGTGLMSIMWAQDGHNVHGLDVNEVLIDIARQRAKDENLNIEFSLGSATSLPWEDASMDVCIAPELLEHVEEWKLCINEFVRILKPNGVLYVSTANKLCPKQEEFNLPFYSWYPAPIKRYCENLARTTHPQIAGYTKYPAVNWFSFYQLRKELSKVGMESFDRFDIMDINAKPPYQKFIINLIKCNYILRWLGHVGTPGLPILAIKKPK
jgi:2-polyprenyl-3-methyl-5-hydroxy-6-metoxy-1,4-benzoquinol methylase